MCSSDLSIVYKSIYYTNVILIIFIINVIDACSCDYHTYDIRENLKLGFVVKVVAAFRDTSTSGKFGTSVGVRILLAIWSKQFTNS